MPSNIFSLPDVDKELNDAPEENDFEGNVVKRIYLGSCLDLCPSGKFYTPWAQGNVTEEEIAADAEWYSQAEAELSEIGASLAAGEGDPTDIFAEKVIRSFMDEDQAEEMGHRSVAEDLEKMLQEGE